MFALSCLSCWFLIIRFACSSFAVDGIELRTRTTRDLAQHREVHAYERGSQSRDREKIDSSRLFAGFLLALRPTLACGYPCSRIGPRRHSAMLKPTAQSIRIRRENKHGKIGFKRTVALPNDLHSKRFSSAAMVSIEVTTPWLGAIAAASAHGLTDFRWRPIFLAPYLLMFAPIPTEFVTVLFICASIQHFSHDIGIKRSVLLHTTFVALAPVLPQTAWSVFALFYCACHVPMHFVRHVSEVDGRLVAMILVAAIISGLGMHGVETLELTDTMQLGVIAHIAVDEIQKGLKLPSN